MNSDYNIHRRSQEKQKKQKTFIARKRQTEKIWWYDPCPAVKFFKKPRRFIAELSSISIKVLDYIIAFGYSNEKIFISQKTIAVRIGVSRESVNRALRPLEEMGLIFNNYRHFKTSFYRIAKCFKTKRMIKKLSSLLPALLLGIMWPITQYKELSSLRLNLNNNSRISSLIKDVRASVGAYSFYNNPPAHPKVGNMNISYNKEKTIEAIKQINAIRLTKAGKLHISRYNAAVIHKAEKTLRTLKGKTIDVFITFENLCTQISRDLNMETDNKILEEAYNSGKISGSEKYLEENKIFTDSYYERPESGAYALYQISDTGPKFQTLIEERDRCIKQLNEPVPPHIAFLCLEEAHFTFLKNKIDKLNSKIDALKAKEISHE